MTFAPAVTEQRFVLKHVAGLDELGVDGEIIDMKRAATFFYVEQIVPEAPGLRPAATASANILFSMKAETLAH